MNEYSVGLFSYANGYSGGREGRTDPQGAPTPSALRLHNRSAVWKNSARRMTQCRLVDALNCVVPFVNWISSRSKYDVCPESKDTQVLNMYSIFNLQKRHCE